MNANWTLNWKKLARGLYWAVAFGSIAVFSSGPVLAQQGRDGGGKGGGQGGGRQGGGGRPGGGGGGAGVRAATPNVGGAARAATPGPSGGGTRAAAPSTNPGAGARIAPPNAPGVNAGAAARTPGAGAGIRADGAPRATVNPPRIDAGAAVRSQTARGEIDGRIDGPNRNLNPAGRADVDGGARTVLRPNLDGANVDGRGRVDVDADARVRGGADARVRGEGNARIPGDANVRGSDNFRANWYRDSRGNPDAFRSTFGNAMNAQVAAGGAARGSNWSNWSGRVRNGFYVGSSPYFNNGFWTGRNLIGFGLGSGVGYGGYNNWWGYSPWRGNQPWNYWYGNPGWNTFAGYYGWNSPYYYDYGPSGNIVYRGDQVLVNNQPVGTPTDYAQSAAELAMVTEEQMNAPHDWMPLGTFAVATRQDETNPPRVAQLAYDNKQGLISGTIFNRDSNNTYTVQGKVDPQTQRVAFTIGKDPNVVLETGLYNLTQNETPVLVHFGSNKTATYLFTRLAEPESSAQPATAPNDLPPPAPTDDRQR